MSTTEALRMQLDALQTDSLKVENRRLREEQPKLAEEFDLERELAATREENHKLLLTWKTFTGSRGERRRRG